MNQTRYCSTCGTLLTEGAAICGECGARYQASPYERRATDAPGAWSQAPVPRSRDLGRQDEASSGDEGIELISRDSLEPRNPGATTLRSGEQYDQEMVTQPPMQQNAPGPAPGPPGSPAPAPAGLGSPAAGPGALSSGPGMERPLDGCSPASPVKRLVAAVLDSVIATLMFVPQIIGWILFATAEEVGTLPLVLIGVGVALPLAYVLVMIWLVGAKGFSIGKLILGLRVTRESEAGPIGFLRSAGRWLLYGVIPPVMALSIFIDPKKHLRGFHDRVVDSVVVDIKAGRNPMKPRPDDFEREGAEHYLGASSVAVSTHENLLAEPGAAWAEPAGSGPEQAADTGWGGAPSQGAPSPYAPPASGSSATSAAEAPVAAAPWSAPEPGAAQQGGGSGWAPPPTDPIPPQQSWGQPQSAPEAPQQSWGQPQSAPEAPQQSWGQPQAPAGQEPAAQAPSDFSAQPWGRPSDDPVAPQADVAQGWAPPPPAAEPMHPAPGPYGQAAPGADPQAPAQHPSDLTGDAWGNEDHGVDEQTRLTAADDPLGDMEQTRISAVQLPPVSQLRLTTDDGGERVVDRPVVIGRNPSAPGQEVLFVMKDDTRSVSKTHLRVDGTGDEITVTDLGSTNGSTVLREDGSRENLVPDTPTVLPAGAQVTLGDRTLTVERVQ